MQNVLARRLLENWFKQVWIQADVNQMDYYYAPFVQGEFNRKPFTRENVEEHCMWCKKNEQIIHFVIADVIAECNKISFRIQYQFNDQNKQTHEAENMGIFHLNEEGKIAKIWVKSSEQFGTE